VGYLADAPKADEEREIIDGKEQYKVKRKIQAQELNVPSADSAG
jgi:hypothetical protein